MIDLIFLSINLRDTPFLDQKILKFLLVLSLLRSKNYLYKTRLLIRIGNIFSASKKSVLELIVFFRSSNIFFQKEDSFSILIIFLKVHLCILLLFILNKNIQFVFQFHNYFLNISENFFS